MAGKNNKKGKDIVEATVQAANEVEVAAKRGRASRSYPNYLKSPSGVIYGPDYSVPNILETGGAEVDGVKASALRAISRAGHGSHKGWVITDAQGNPIPGPERAPRKVKQAEVAPEDEQEVEDNELFQEEEDEEDWDLEE